MQLRLLLEALDRLDEKISEKAIMQAVNMAPTNSERAMILAKLARENNLPGLYDPTDGIYYNVNGERERSPDSETTKMLANLGLLPKNAQTNMFGMFGSDKIDDLGKQHSFDINYKEKVNELIQRLSELTDMISVNLQESKKRKKSLSSSLYESFFGLDEAQTDYKIGSAGAMAPGAMAPYRAAELGSQPDSVRFAEEIVEMKQLIKDLSDMHSARPDQGIVSAIARAKDAIKRVYKASQQPPKPPPSPPKPSIDWSGVTEKEPLTYKPPEPQPRPEPFVPNPTGLDGEGGDKPKPPGPTPTPGPSPNPSPIAPQVNPEVDLAKREKNKKRARELLDKIKKQLASKPDTPGPVTPQVDPNNPNQPSTNPHEILPHDDRDRFEEPLPGSQDQINSIKNMQRELKAVGADLGTFGPNGDGIDGKIGNKTREAMARYPKVAAKYADNFTGVTQYNNRTTPKPQNKKKPTTQITPQPQPAPGPSPTATIPNSISDLANQEIARKSAKESIEDNRILDQIRNMRF
jgi:hypothetical protein